MKAVYWLRNDLRISDNEALVQCLKGHQETVFVFASTKSIKRSGPIRQTFIQKCFLSLKSELEGRGFKVLQVDVSFSHFLPELRKSFDFNHLYFTQEYAWEERQDEQLVLDFCLKYNIQAHSFDQGTLIAKPDLPFALKDMPFVFTDFRKRIEAKLLVRPLAPAPFSPKESEGQARLNHYLWKTHAIQDYKQTRNGMLDFDDSSKLSPWLSLGNISARTVYHELKKYETQVVANESTYWLFFELLWRDYFKFFSLKYGPKIFMLSGLGPGVSPNLKNTETFLSWCQGKTRDSFVNANMNELNKTGWMSNRGRQNVASYLIHDLGIDWTWGAAYFEEKLFDYDPDCNWGNWLYLSGRGSDPRARKFNTIKQAETYDPTGEYRRLWELDQS